MSLVCMFQSEIKKKKASKCCNFPATHTILLKIEHPGAYTFGRCQSPDLKRTQRGNHVHKYKTFPHYWTLPTTIQFPKGSSCNIAKRWCRGANINLGRSTRSRRLAVNKRFPSVCVETLGHIYLVCASDARPFTPYCSFNAPMLSSVCTMWLSRTWSTNMGVLILPLLPRPPRHCQNFSEITIQVLEGPQEVDKWFQLNSTWMSSVTGHFNHTGSCRIMRHHLKQERAA